MAKRSAAMRYVDTRVPSPRMWVPMSEVGVIVLLFAAGVLLLMADIFLPSHGILSVSALGLLIWAVVQTFQYGGTNAGLISVAACTLFLPTFAYGAIRIWKKTPIGRRIAPPNPVVTAYDTSIPTAELEALLGRTGRSVSQLRPVGICEFDGQRVSCVSEFGMIEAGTPVLAVRLAGANLAVRPQTA